MQNKNEYDNFFKKKKHFMLQENDGNHQTSPNNNIMCESSSCKNTISNFSNPKMALNTSRSK